MSAHRARRDEAFDDRGSGSHSRGRAAPSGQERPEAQTDMTVLCNDCWEVFEDASAPFCKDPDCRRPRPGWRWPAVRGYELGNYQFVRRLGRGGMGAVFLATDRATGKQHAIKVVVIRPGEDRGRIAEVFRHEMAVANRLGGSASFVRVDETNNPKLYMAMEYLAPPAWTTLEELLKRRKKLTEVEAARIGVAVLDGLREMHELDENHNDLKPANIFVKVSTDATGGALVLTPFRDQPVQVHVVKIADFGVSAIPVTKDLPTALRGQNHRGRWGTPEYMSPEQMEGTKVGFTSDLHAVGSILYECVTGGVPFTVPNLPNSFALRVDACRKGVQRPSPGEMSDAFFDIVREALEYDPAKRFPSAKPSQCAKAFQARLLDFIVERELKELHARLDELSRVLEPKDLLAAHQKLARGVENVLWQPGARDADQLRGLKERLAEVENQITNHVTEAARIIAVKAPKGTPETRPQRPRRSWHTATALGVAAGVTFMVGRALGGGSVRVIERPVERVVRVTEAAPLGETVSLTNPWVPVGGGLEVQQHEVTRGEWSLWTHRGNDAGVVDGCDPRVGGGSLWLPVVCVSQEDAARFCRSLGERNPRLPSPDEWKRVAAVETRWFAGVTLAPTLRVVDGAGVDRHPVGGDGGPEVLGLAGNVRELTTDHDEAHFPVAMGGFAPETRDASVEPWDASVVLDEYMESGGDGRPGTRVGFRCVRSQ